MPIRSQQLPYELVGSSYTFTYLNAGGGGNLWIYGVNAGPVGGFELHVSAHVDTANFETLHISVENGPWERFHMYFREGKDNGTRGYDYCRDQAALDTWYQDNYTTVSDIAADFWNAAEACGFTGPDPTVGDAFDATYAMEREGRFVDTGDDDPDAMSITDVGTPGDKPTLDNGMGKTLEGEYLDYNRILFRGSALLDGEFLMGGVVTTVDETEPARMATPEELAMPTSPYPT